MRRYLKRSFPGAYEMYAHFARKRKALENEKRKGVSSDEMMDQVARIYEERVGHKLDWNNLRTYTEKMQWEKLFDNNPKKTLLSDKYLVRSWVSEQIGEEHLIPLLGCWDCFDEIDFEQLPNQFVLKTNHGSGTIELVKDKRYFDIKAAKRRFDDWMAIDYGYNPDFEIHYSDINRKIICEKYLETNYGELQDYKFLCFDGEPKYCWVDMGRFGNHTRNVYDLDWQLQPWSQETYSRYSEPIPKPDNFNEMIHMARKLAQGFSHVRVDLYNVEGFVYFGEMTFTNGSGLDRIIPEEYDLMLGDCWNLEIDPGELS